MKFLRFVLENRYDVLPGFDWLSPAAFSTGIHSSMGLPWEIFRTWIASGNSSRAVTYYTKGGGLPGYFSYSIVMPVYDLAVFMVVGGDLPVLNEIFKIVRDILPSEAESVAQSQLAAIYAGTYRASTQDANEPVLNSSIVLSQSTTNSLYISSWISNSTDVLAGLVPLVAGQAGLTGDIHFQLVPTFEVAPGKTKDTSGEIWRLINVQDDDPTDVWQDYCIGNYDPLRYVDQPFNEVIFWRKNANNTSVVSEIQITAWNITMERS